MHITWEIIILCITAFAAGFIDAIVGGGGLIQTPIGLIVYPNLPVSTVIGTLKIPSCAGTIIAAYQYLKKYRIAFFKIVLLCTIAFTTSLLGSYLQTKVSNAFFKPVIFFVLVLVALYTFMNKNFGVQKKAVFNSSSSTLVLIIICTLMGFYDGFIGPGMGSILVMLLIALLGYDFLKANTYTKCINVATNIGSIILFGIKGHLILSIAIPMAICNCIGGWLGAKMALLKGNSFIRIMFLIVVLVTLCRLGYDIFYVKKYYQILSIIFVDSIYDSRHILQALTILTTIA
jgi:uncharacterized protein